MNNIYLFRGKRVDNGEWVMGDLIQWRDNDLKIWSELPPTDEKYKNPVIPETVGQCTGLKDKNGKLIFEGDIVLASSQKWRCAVVFDNENARFICHTNDKPCRLVYVSMQYKDNTSALEVIGNIHDNPELLEVEE